MSNKPDNKVAGFTLLEVMVALALIAVALVVLLGLAQRSILTGERLKQMTRATLLAKEQMAEIESGRFDSSGELSGAFEEPNELMHWRVEYTPTPLQGIQQVDLHVLWGEMDRNEMVTLSTFVMAGG